MKATKNIIVTLLILVLLGTCMVSNAATPRSIRINPQLSFSGQTTKCRAVIMADSSTDKISVVVKLYKNGHCINMWSESGEGTLYFEEESTAVKGCSYRMTVSATVKGVTQPTVTTSKVYE